MSDTHRHRVVIAGAGVAGLEALVALSETAPGVADVTLLAPNREFRIQATTVEEPFARPQGRRYPVADICADLGARLVTDSLAAVDSESGHVTTSNGTLIPYDSLLLAIGAKRGQAFAHGATLFRGDQDAEAMGGLIADVEGGYVKRIVFVVPSGVTWPLPLYELALMTAGRAREMGQNDLSIAIVTPEDRPLGQFGQRASDAVAKTLDEAGIEVMVSTYVDRMAGGNLFLSPSGRLVPAGRVVTVPRLSGPAVPGVPCDDDGFVVVDKHCRVHGTDNVFAAGDGTVFPIKQGGIAAQQADVAAAEMARRAGAEVPPLAFDPVLRAKLLTGSRTEYLRAALGPEGGEETSTASEHSLWWPPSKVAAPYLAGYLEGSPAREHAASPPVIHSEGDPEGGIELLAE